MENHEKNHETHSLSVYNDRMKKFQVSYIYSYLYNLYLSYIFIFTLEQVVRQALVTAYECISSLQLRQSSLTGVCLLKSLSSRVAHCNISFSQMSKRPSDSQMETERTDTSIIRIPPHHYIHVLDQNTNIARVEIGPLTYIRQDNERQPQGI